MSNAKITDLYVQRVKVDVLAEQLEKERSERIKQWDVFISHAIVDRGKLDRLITSLEDSDVKFWIAPDGLTPGEEWNPAIIQNVRASQQLIVAWSENASKSDFVKIEIGAMLALGRPIIPVGLDGNVQNLPSYLAKYQCFDYTKDLAPLIRQLKVLW